MTAIDIISAFGSARDFAASIGVQRATVLKWRQRNSIPAQYDVPIVQAATAKGLSISFEDLARLRASDEAAA